MISNILILDIKAINENNILVPLSKKLPVIFTLNNSNKCELSFIKSNSDKEESNQEVAHTSKNNIDLDLNIKLSPIKNQPSIELKNDICSFSDLKKNPPIINPIRKDEDSNLQSDKNKIKLNGVFELLSKYMFYVKYFRSSRLYF